MAMKTLKDKYCIVGVGETEYSRGSGRTTRAMAVEAFRALVCQGLARVDFFVGPDGEPTINEVNTMPGFTTKSAYPKMWEVTGVDYPALLTTLIETAIARGTGLR